FHSKLPKGAEAQCGHIFAPRPVAVCPTANILRAAFSSRSCVAPQSHVHCRTDSGMADCRQPHSAHILLLGNHRSILITVLPCIADLLSMARIALPMLASLRLRARLWFLTMPRRLRSSTQIVSKRL